MTTPPVAEPEPPRSLFGWVWLVPLLALTLAAWLAWGAWGERGVIVTIQLDDGHGLVPGSALRHRGIDVGVTEEVALLDNDSGVVATVRLAPHASGLARVGSRFWVVRPRIGWDGIGGLDTLVGRRYLAVLPGSGAEQRHFIALDEPPLGDALAPGLDVVLLGARRDGLVPGSPLRFRGVRVGTVLTVGLSSDAARVRVTARVRQEYAALVRERTHFWTTSGIRFDAGFTGVTLDVETLESLVIGGIALAVPPNAGAPVAAHHRFTLHARPDDDWLEWSPPVGLAGSIAPGVPAPVPQRAILRWREGLLYTTDESRSGWVIATPAGYVGPRDLLVAPEDADEGTVTLEVDGTALDLTEPRGLGDALVILPTTTPPPASWIPTAWRAPTEPVDCAVYADPTAEPIALSPGRFTDGWKLEPALALSRELHGAPVVDRSDGAWIGVLLVERDGSAEVAPLTEGVGESFDG